jgi:hypothetical protein
VRRVIHVQIRSDGADDHLAGVEPYADAPGAASVRVWLWQRLLAPGAANVRVVRLRHGNGAHEAGDRRRRVLMLAILPEGANVGHPPGGC